MKLRSFRLALLPAIFLFLAACQTTQQPDPASRITVIEGATVIDGVSDAPIEDAILVIEGDTIRNVGRRGTIEVPENAARINATGKTIMPGLFNLHGHIGMASGVGKITTPNGFCATPISIFIMASCTRFRSGSTTTR